MIQRIDEHDLIFQNERGKFTAIIDKVKAVNQSGQPILIGTASIESNERLSQALTQAGVKHTMLNAKNHEREGEIIAEAGKIGAVTLATNMAGRGVDIKLGGPDASEEESEKVKMLGGLFVLGTERHEARRIDNQLRGRAGRQGDSGRTQFYVSMDDSLMRVFGGERVKNLMGTFGIPENEPIQMKMISKTLESAQTKIEGFHFDSRKQILAYDDVLNLQRTVIYKRRQKLLLGDSAEVQAVIEELVAEHPLAAEVIEAKKQELGEEVFTDVFRRLSLQMIDMLWVEHLEVMGYTRSSVGLRAYGQRDPLIEYRKEATQLFKEMQHVLQHRILEVLPNLQPQVVVKEEAERKEEAKVAQETAGETMESKDKKATPLVKNEDFGRNELVTISKGTETQQVKFKRLDEYLKEGWTLVK
jgi:preprotein translocase subunit SecA